MRMKNLTVLAIVLVFVFTATFASTEPWKGKWRGSGGWGPGTPYHQVYNPAAAETLTGEVVRIDKTVPMKRMDYGIALVVKTDKETIPVLLGPGWYIERLDKPFAVGDKVEIRGVRTTFSGQPTIIAAEVKKDDQALVLRDASGIPVWAAWRR